MADCRALLTALPGFTGRGPSPSRPVRLSNGILVSILGLRLTLPVHKNNTAAIEAFDGGLIVQVYICNHYFHSHSKGNNFQQPGVQVHLHTDVKKAVVVGNIVTGEVNVINESKGV